MKKIKRLALILLALAILGSLIWGVILGDPQNMRVEASGL